MEHEYSAKLLKWASSGEYTDLILSCAGHQIPVHQIIVCAHSQFFHVACSGGFKESSTKVIDLPDDLPTVRRMISYMYTFNYDDHDDNHDGDDNDDDDDDDHGHKCAEEDASIAEDGKNDVTSISETDSDQSELFSSIRVYAIAEKYNILGLKSLALSKFTAWAEEHWDSVHYPPMAEEAFSITPPEDVSLKDVIVDSIVKHISLLDRVEWHAVIWENSYLCSKVLDQVATLLTRARLRAEIKQKEHGAQVQQLEDEKVSLSLRLSQIVKTVNKTSACRHCTARFDACLDVDVLRCRECKTRHH